MAQCISDLLWDSASRTQEKVKEKLDANMTLFKRQVRIECKTRPSSFEILLALFDPLPEEEEVVLQV
jgi:hypothetical protein